tara:strand:- start:397 stop:645 length:249 start_codon:yes stop_codon:yes gene_type:complete
MANTTGKKHGGREKGTPNKLTKELRSVLKEVIYNELENIEERLDELEPKQRLELVVKLMPYVFPKMVSASHTINEPLDWGVD